MRAAGRAELVRMAVLFACAGLVMTGASAAEIKVIASNAVKEAYTEILPEFEKSAGHKVAVDWGGTADIAKRVDGGEAADLVIIPSFTIDELMARGKVRTGSRVDLVRSIIGVAVRIGAPRPDLSSGEGLKTSLLASNRIVLSGGPSGGTMAKLFETWGIADPLKGKVIRIGVGLPVGGALARGEGDIGFTQVSEFLSFPGIDYRGPLPADIQQVTIFSSAVPAAAPAGTEPAKALVQFLTAPHAVPVLKRHGLEPG